MLQRATPTLWQNPLQSCFTALMRHKASGQCSATRRPVSTQNVILFLFVIELFSYAVKVFQATIRASWDLGQGTGFEGRCRRINLNGNIFNYFLSFCFCYSLHIVWVLDSVWKQSQCYIHSTVPMILQVFLFYTSWMIVLDVENVCITLSLKWTAWQRWHSEAIY